MIENRIKKAILYVWTVVLITLTLFAGLEIVARALIQQPIGASQGSPAERTLLFKQPWGNQVAIDASGDSAKYVPYVEFRERPYVSQTLNIDRESRRLVPGNCARNDALTVMTFGGSTMFGAGVPDESTIPAYLAAQLNRDGLCVRVVNYGSSWWQSSQSLIQLIELLKSGTRPDLVIFYDGVNEIYTVAHGGKAGSIDPEAEKSLKQAFETDRTFIKVLARNSYLVRSLRQFVFSPDEDDSAKVELKTEASRSERAQAIVDVYVQNVRIVTALAREYGFAVHFFLQPCFAVSKKRATVLEETIFRELTQHQKWMPDFFRLSYDLFKRSEYLASNPHYHDLSSIFDGLEEELFQDSEHLLPPGNKIVAEKIARTISADLRGGAQAIAPSPAEK